MKQALHPSKSYHALHCVTCGSKLVIEIRPRDLVIHPQVIGPIGSKWAHTFIVSRSSSRGCGLQFGFIRVCIPYTQFINYMCVCIYIYIYSTTPNNIFTRGA
jgi:hypothetical protein